jgi:RsiW-degrading membrane proteinase PrsW (M82 family)
MGQNGPMESSGKHAGKRRAEPGHQATHQPTHQATPDVAEASTRSRTPLLLLALGVTLSVVAWGYLVYAAIDFGANARAGETNSWWLLGMASIGAVACLFVGLLLVARLLRMLGVLKTEAPKPPRPVGGKRAAR